MTKAMLACKSKMAQATDRFNDAMETLANVERFGTISSKVISSLLGITSDTEMREWKLKAMRAAVAQATWTLTDLVEAIDEFDAAKGTTP